MAKDTITLALNGDNIPIQKFAIAISNFDTLVHELSKELGGNRIQWVIQDLQISSAIATIRGKSDETAEVEQIVDAYEEIGQALESGKRPNYSETVVKAASAITDILDKQVTSIRFETANNDHVVYKQLTDLFKKAAIVKAYSSIEGIVQTLTNRGGLRFTLFDTLYDRAVSCYLHEGQEEIMREAWGKRVVIEGELSRDFLSGRPIAIRDIISVRFVPETQKGSYLNARGIFPLKNGAPLPEEAIRRVRDAN